ncbi:MAG: molybdopterin-dependent oxidoreductase, partial [Coriobacteriales bacterium]|jgi:anaerobic selenocysteine-containing dehydrogenase|nr:molybdopterin-dependent oxidoreductase [Coriobacteriales bacterium]
VHVDGNDITRVEGDPNHPVSRGMLCCKAFSAQQIHADPNRLAYPLKRKGPRGAGEWERISWSEAYDLIVENIKSIQAKYGPAAFLISQGTGRGSNHWHFRIDKTIGTGGFCLAPTHVCLMPNLLPTLHTFGFYSFTDAADILNGNCCVMWGINAFTSWAGTAGHQILEAKQRGCKLIVIDPRFTELASKADIWMQPKPGSDLAIALALLNVVIADKLYDADFCEKWTYGFDEMAESVKEYTPEWAESISWVPADTIRAAAHMMGECRPTNITSSLGSSVHENGMHTGRAIANLMSILGDLDAKGGNLSNKSWDVMLAHEITLISEEVIENIKKLPGLDEKPLLAMAGQAWPHAVWENAKKRDDAPRPVRGIVTIANDIPMCYEEADNAMEGLSNMDFICVKDYYMNAMSHIADLVLPSSHWSEREGQHDEEILSEPCPFVVPQKAVDPPGECIDDWEFILQLGKRFNEEEWPWANTREMHQWRLKTFYDVDKPWEQLLEEPYIITYGGDKRVYQKYAQGLERPDGGLGFRTPSGRVELYNNTYDHFGYGPLPKWQAPSVYDNEAMAEQYPLYLMSGGRIYPYYHSAWTNIPMQREIAKDPYIELHPDAARARGISDGDWVRVKAPNDKQIVAKAVVTKAIDARCAHLPRPGWKHACQELGLKGYGYKEANPNMLMPGNPSDGTYGTPPYRSWRCEIEKLEA